MSFVLAFSSIYQTLAEVEEKIILQKMRHIYFTVQEILIMILKKDLVHARARKLCKYNEGPSDCTIEVGLKEIFFEKV